MTVVLLLLVGGAVGAGLNVIWEDAWELFKLYREERER